MNDPTGREIVLIFHTQDEFPFEHYSGQNAACDFFFHNSASNDKRQDTVLNPFMPLTLHDESFVPTVNNFVKHKTRREVKGGLMFIKRQSS